MRKIQERASFYTPGTEVRKALADIDRYSQATKIEKNAADNEKRRECRATILKLKKEGLSKEEIIKILIEKDMIPELWKKNVDMLNNQVDDYMGGKTIYSSYDER